MIINVRGTHGSGKSTIMRTMINSYGAQPLYGLLGARPEAYMLTVGQLDRFVYILGPYITACGGCDAVQPYDLILELLEKYAPEGHVLFEGALVSSIYGRVGKWMEQFGQQAIMAFLDTPLDVCLERIARRRRERGDDRPLNPANTIAKARSTKSTRAQLERAGILRAVQLHWDCAVPELLMLLSEGSSHGTIVEMDRGARADQNSKGEGPFRAMDGGSNSSQLSFL